ncbi:MAG: tRNA (adenosine(37)-N6)-threonylcarbamoyltransferase complex dimerization subunit type 1 TsaB [Saprospiraceae bacterium]|nr:tRNA (adenosine(37)-N6)-threonylcarbamoyltransferase complex dimerization subunit type 1 TsaB [Saprospiraceae bacterium]
MSKILLLETSSEVCSVAVAIDGRVTALVETPETLQHAALLTIQIQECLHQSGLPLAVMDAVALSKGPGSYTSLRVGASVAKGICYALDKPLIAVDTLHALALASKNADTGATPDALYVPMLDARRQEVWLALFDGQLKEVAPPQPLIFENNSFEKYLLDKTGSPALLRIVLSGNGAVKATSATIPNQTVISNITKCSASFLAPLAEEAFQKADFQDIAYFEPFYMKPPNITTPRESTLLTKI